jgi:hypothetical protein
MTNKHRKVWKIISKKPFFMKQTGLKKISIFTIIMFDKVDLCYLAYLMKINYYL